MCRICELSESLGVKSPIVHERKTYRDRLVEERATLTVRIQTIDILLDKMDKFPEIEEFINLSTKD